MSAPTIPLMLDRPVEDPNVNLSHQAEFHDKSRSVVEIGTARFPWQRLRPNDPRVHQYYDTLSGSCQPNMHRNIRKHKGMPTTGIS